MKKVPFFISFVVLLLASYFFCTRDMGITYLVPVVAALATTIKYGYDAFKKEPVVKSGNSQVQIVTGGSSAKQANGNINDKNN